MLRVSIVPTSTFNKGTNCNSKADEGKKLEILTLERVYDEFPKTRQRLLKVSLKLLINLIRFYIYIFITAGI